MFFTSELLASRDSGFGLLWLAATLGSKSAFKKLPKRSIITADIAQLCDLIAEPLEPLALRLSSNLLVGVARVYKVKQDIFLNDVSACFSSLKKMVQDFRSTAVMDARLQLAQGSVRPSVVTLSANLQGTIAMDFDAFITDWDEYLNIGDQPLISVDTDDENFDPQESHTRKKGKKPKANVPLSQAEHPRAELYTLSEHHDHILSASFDLSFNGDGNDAIGLSSSHATDFGFDDNIFAMSDGLDVGVLADELAKELGWATPTKDGEIDFPIAGPDLGIHIGFSPLSVGILNTELPAEANPGGKKRLKRKGDSLLDKAEDFPNSRSPALTHVCALSPATSFSRLLLSQDDAPILLQDITMEEQNRADTEIKKMKKTRLLLDARTELTDEELKTARAHYLQAQDTLRRGLELKQAEKQSGNILEEKVWGVPACICAPMLADFWRENFKVQVEARTGVLHIHLGSEHPHKRRRIEISTQEVPVADGCQSVTFDQQATAINPVNKFHVQDVQDNLRSSEEPGQGRRISREASIIGDFAVDLGTQNADPGSQQSSMFPWDNAGGSLSSGGLPASDHNLPVDHVEIRMRESSQSRRESSLVPSHVGSLVGGSGFSPAPVYRSSQAFEEDYAFEVNIHEHDESQRSDTNLIALERNSFNFLEYVKMQSYSLSSSATDLTFDIVVPQMTSTRHVAASAFYHCLVLATKDLLQLKQTDAHGRLIITVL